MDILVRIVCVLSECIYVTKVFTLVSWLGGMPQPRFGHCHQWHPQTYIILVWECGHSPEQAMLTVTVVTWSEDQESCTVTQYRGISMTEGKVWLLKQDLLSTVKNDYGSNLNLINKSIILSWFVFLHIEWTKMQSHSHWSHGKSFSTEVNWSEIKFTLLTFFILPK